MLRMRRFSLKELENMPVQHQGHFDNIMIDKKDYRVALSRMTVEDGMPYNNQVTHERLFNGVWETVDQYEALKGFKY
jgi:hypothetical protein